MLRELLAQRIPDQRWFGAGQVMKKRATAERSGTVSRSHTITGSVIVPHTPSYISL